MADKKTETKMKNDTKESKLSPFQQELAEAVTKVMEYKKPAEANVVSILYKNPELLYSYDNLNIDMFSHNCWKVYFEIIKSIVLDEKIQKVTEIEIGLYLEKHPKLRDKYDEYGGYAGIADCGKYVKEENLEAYLNDLKKWNCVLDLGKNRFPIADMLSNFADMSLDEIYNYYEAKMNHTFINADTGIKSYDLSDGIYDYINELDEGCQVGLPFYQMPLLNRHTSGLKLGDMNLICGVSNVGKSSYARNLILPSIILNHEKVVLMLNEESHQRVQFEMLVWVANNILHKDLQKYQVRDGHFTEEIKKILIESADWISQYKKDNAVTIVPFASYNTSTAIKTIRKYAALNCKYFILDTFKADAKGGSQNTWMDLQQNAVALYDVIKPETGNLSLTLLFQLEKGKGVRQRYLGMDNLGISKNVIDCASEAIFIRQMFDDEMPNQKNALQVYRLEGSKGKTKIPVSLDDSGDKNYHIIFIGKTRSSSKSDQVVVDANLSNNVMTEIGITHVPMDFS